MYKRRVKLSKETLGLAGVVTDYYSRVQGRPIPLEGILSDAVVIGLEVAMREVQERLRESTEPVSERTEDSEGIVSDGGTPEIPG